VAKIKEPRSDERTEALCTHAQNGIASKGMATWLLNDKEAANRGGGFDWTDRYPLIRDAVAVLRTASAVGRRRGGMLRRGRCGSIRSRGKGLLSIEALSNAAVRYGSFGRP
jgi:hypothetical protein